MPATKRAIAVALAVSLAGGSAPSAPAADASFLSKRGARAYLVREMPKRAPRVLLGDERAAFFRVARLSVTRAARCRRRGESSVSCRFRARLEPDAEHRRRNWWPITCRGVVLVRLRGDDRLQGFQRDYVCRTVHPDR